jgi:hypothetical protein
MEWCCVGEEGVQWGSGGVVQHRRSIVGES